MNKQWTQDSAVNTFVLFGLPVGEELIAIHDVDSKGGFLWNSCQVHSLEHPVRALQLLL